MKKAKTVPKSKVCTECGTDKPIDDFRTHKSGFNLNQCRQCERDMAKKRIEDKHSKTVTATTTKKGKLIPFSIFCNKCGKDKPIADFRTNKSGGFPNQCRQCEKEMAKESIGGKRG